LDIMLPNEDGMSILRRLREREEYARIPVIMVTAKGTEFDKVMGLDTGADDYITKPIDEEEIQKLTEKAGRSTYVALLLFVGIPIPGTGAWTGTLAASLLDLDFKKSSIAVICGVVLAGIIMLSLSMLGLKALGA
ncbi:MAG: small multi-drug export protein, partial [Candidatus Saccharibacteria bacterium]|nr:small multi-drug export protein [Candidatus Saccharibacteria bacterium]